MPDQASDLHSPARSSISPAQSRWFSPKARAFPRTQLALMHDHVDPWPNPLVQSCAPQQLQLQALYKDSQLRRSISSPNSRRKRIPCCTTESHTQVVQQGMRFLRLSSTNAKGPNTIIEWAGDCQESSITVSMISFCFC